MMIRRQHNYSTTDQRAAALWFARAPVVKNKPMMDIKRLHPFNQSPESVDPTEARKTTLILRVNDPSIHPFQPNPIINI